MTGPLEQAGAAALTSKSAEEDEIAATALKEARQLVRTLEQSLESAKLSIFGKGPADEPAVGTCASGHRSLCAF